MTSHAAMWNMCGWGIGPHLPGKKPDYLRLMRNLHYCVPRDSLQLRSFLDSGKVLAIVSRRDFHPEALGSLQTKHG